MDSVLYVISFLFVSVGYCYMVATDNKEQRIKSAIVNYAATVFCLIMYYLDKMV